MSHSITLSHSTTGRENLPVLVLISLTSPRSIADVQLVHFSPDNLLAGKGLYGFESATLSKARGAEKIAFHTWKDGQSSDLLLSRPVDRKIFQLRHYFKRCARIELRKLQIV